MITPDYKKVQRFSANKAFKNNNLYTGGFQITGSIPPGVTTRTFSTAMRATPDMMQVVFNTSATSIYNTSPYPSSSWWKQGIVLDDAGGLGAVWVVSWTITGTTLTFTAMVVNQTSTTYTSAGPTVNYRAIDYSVF